jgi:hypothetical protein
MLDVGRREFMYPKGLPRFLRPLRLPLTGPVLILTIFICVFRSPGRSGHSEIIASGGLAL